MIDSVSSSSVEGSDSLSLDTFARFSSAQDFSSVIRSRRWRLQKAAGRILPNFRVRYCGRKILGGASGVTVFKGVVSDDCESRTWLGGVETCSSVWCCPVCAAKITEKRRQDVLMAVETARTMNLKPVMVTLTYSHSKTQSLLVGRVAINEALARLKSGRAWQAIKAKYGIVGSIRALEVTHGDSNGWHPHSHELMFIGSDADVKALGDEICSRWLDCLGALGLSGSDLGFSIVDTDRAVAEYLAKWGKPKKWTVDRELTKLHTKIANKRDANGHYSPFELLEFAADGDVQAAQLFYEFATTFKGAKQLVWSRGLHKMLLAEDEKTDEAITEEMDENGTPVAFVDRETWGLIVSRDLIADLLVMCAIGDEIEISRWLSDLWL